MKLCVFIHFSNDNFIPKYVQIYLKELVRHFDEIILVTNKRAIHSGVGELHSKIRLQEVTNEGYDLGMFYKAFQTLELDNYSQIACINDSNILFNVLDRIFEWGKVNSFDFWGLIDSYQEPWFSSHQDSYHIQSHFLVFNKKAIELLPGFFQSLNLNHLFQEENKKLLRRKVIDKWEIGITQYMVKSGLSVGSFYDSKIVQLQNNIKKDINLSHNQYASLIESGYPLIKKKIIMKNRWIMDFLRPRLKWDILLLKHGHREWKIVQLIQELTSMKK